MRTETKQKIAEAALRRFNQEGIVNVRLQHIADEAGISVGNLAYHFANKASIAQHLYEALAEAQRELMKAYRMVPLFEYIERLMAESFALQGRYEFFYLDSLEILRAYPAIGAAHRQHIAMQVQQLRGMIAFNVARGAFQGEPWPGLHDALAAQWWMLMDFWLPQQALREDAPPSATAYQQAVWALLMPHFSDMGWREYRQLQQRPYEGLF